MQLIIVGTYPYPEYGGVLLAPWLTCQYMLQGSMTPQPMFASAIMPSLPMFQCFRHSFPQKVIIHSYQTPRTLAIGQAQAHGTSLLPGTIKELALIRQICSPQVISLEGPHANITSVVAELPSAALVHFASHGQQVDPGFDSGLILYDGRLQVSDLIRQQVPLGRLAFLSACETARGEKFVFPGSKFV